jgi:hypothetical protein
MAVRMPTACSFCHPSGVTACRFSDRKKTPNGVSPPPARMRPPRSRALCKPSTEIARRWLCLFSVSMRQP